MVDGRGGRPNPYLKGEGGGFSKNREKDKIEDMIFRKKYDKKRYDLKLKRYERYLKKIDLDFWKR